MIHIVVTYWDKCTQDWTKELNIGANIGAEHSLTWVLRADWDSSPQKTFILAFTGKYKNKTNRWFHPPGTDRGCHESCFHFRTWKQDKRKLHMPFPTHVVRYSRFQVLLLFCRRPAEGLDRLRTYLRSQGITGLQINFNVIIGVLIQIAFIMTTGGQYFK